MERVYEKGVFKEHEIRALCGDGARAYLPARFTEREGKLFVYYDEAGYAPLAVFKPESEKEVLLVSKAFFRCLMNAEDSLADPDLMEGGMESAFVTQSERGFKILFAYFKGGREAGDGAVSLHGQEVGSLARKILLPFLEENRGLDRLGEIAELCEVIKRGERKTEKLLNLCKDLRAELEKNAF